MSRMLNLASKCEAATGPDRTLERDIALATGWSEYSEQCEDDYTDRGWFSPDGKAGAWHPFYTRSLDAAMGLVPEGLRLSTLSSESMAESWRATLWRMDGNEPMPVGGVPSGRAATPALALCAAALRARASQEGEG